MAHSWKRSVYAAAMPLLFALSTLYSPLTHAAADPCKVNAKSAACKAEQAKAAKKAPAKTGAKAPAAKTAAKQAPAKTAAKSTSKHTAKAASARKTVATTRTVAGRKETVIRTAAGKPATVTTRTLTPVRTTATADAGQAVARLSTPSSQAAALRSSVAYVQDLATSTVLFSKNEDTVRPIASISKLMTALVVVDANQPMDEMLEVSDDDIDRLRHAASRLPVGTRLSRADMLHVALMSSENRAAHALGRYYPGGMPAFVRAMNEKARELGMLDTHFVEPTGLSSENVSSPRDLVRLLRAASQRPLIHRYTTDTEYDVEMRKGRTQTFHNTNALVRNADWDIKVSKTGYINEAGECLVMLARINGRDLAIVLLDSQGKYSRVADAVRIRKFVQNEVAML
ncbi:D-alanyl-D-alanine endopeptidase [Bordetella genomosp. 10]|uniref:D-alanyl-D-alanine endopeptidase n=1 Tax=Bordetella genomosp. 10 TaxID=1416804 RepID=A0A261S0L1_9BORD|nr:D-alanyl-D-alanine endopeptidase [Bordetella genomosp. 10]OZI30889.1 D-alanyl-D-alanine endopeptidase [Bordetella genomosp. 10]